MQSSIYKYSLPPLTMTPVTVTFWLQWQIWQFPIVLSYKKMMWLEWNLLTGTFFSRPQGVTVTEDVCTEPEIMVCTWLGELCYCSCLPVLPGLARVLLSYVLHTFISGSVLGIWDHSVQDRIGGLTTVGLGKHWYRSFHCGSICVWNTGLARLTPLPLGIAVTVTLIGV